MPIRELPPRGMRRVQVLEVEVALAPSAYDVCYEPPTLRVERERVAELARARRAYCDVVLRVVAELVEPPLCAKEALGAYRGVRGHPLVEEAVGGRCPLDAWMLAAIDGVDVGDRTARDINHAERGRVRVPSAHLVDDLFAIPRGPPVVEGQTPVTRPRVRIEERALRARPFADVDDRALAIGISPLAEEPPAVRLRCPPLLPPERKLR